MTAPTPPTPPVSLTTTALEITAQPVYQAAAADPPEDDSDLRDPSHLSDADPSADPAADEDDNGLEELVQLDSRELAENIRQLSEKLKKKKNIFSFDEVTSQTRAEKRDAVVTVLDLVDNIYAIKSSTEEIDTRTIAATEENSHNDRVEQISGLQ